MHYNRNTTDECAPKMSVVFLSALTAPRTATGFEMLSVTAMDFSEDPQLCTTSILCPSVDVIYHDAMVPPFSGDAVIVPSASAG